MKVEEIYAKISQNIVDEIDSSWSVATINSYLGRGCGHFEGRYKGNDDSTDEQCFDVSFATFELFEKMHEVTTEGGKTDGIELSLLFIQTATSTLTSSGFKLCLMR